LPPENSNTLELPVLEDITDDAVWVANPAGPTDVVFAEVDWKKDGYLKLEIVADLGPFYPNYEAKYCPGPTKCDVPCWMEYTTSDGFIVRVEFDDDEVFENDSGTIVMCKKKEKPKVRSVVECFTLYRFQELTHCPFLSDREASHSP